MTFWILFFLTIFFLLFLYSEIKIPRVKEAIKWLIIIVCTYFAAFRDGLGADYNQYLSRLDIVDSFSFTYGLLTEPSFVLISRLIQTTPLSPRFYYFIMSIITIVPILLLLFKHQQPAWSIFVFVTFIGCGYMQSFNVVRQFAAVSMVFVAIDSFMEKRYIRYLIFILLATFFHRSAIFLLAFPLVHFINLKKRWLAASLLVLSIVISYFDFSFISSIHLNISAFENSNEDNLGKTVSTIIIVLNLLVLFIILTNKRTIMDEKDNTIYTIGLLFVYIYNLSVNNIIYSRMALYFAPFIYILLTFPTKDNRIQGPYKIILSVVFLGVLSRFLLTMGDDPTIMPKQILPVSCIFD